jgi:chromate reductase, NAD(P)H dehydrogenase (quinone)
MTKPIHVLALSGSLRQDSHNTAALHAAAELAPAGMTIQLYDLAAIPLYNEDVRAAGEPAAVRDLRAAIAAADAVLIATPEYNYSIPGVLKNAIDWVSRPPAPPLHDKPVAIMGASGSGFGTVRAQLHLRQILAWTNAHPLNRPEVHIARAGEKFDAAGRLTDEATRESIAALLQALAAWTLRLRGEAPAPVALPRAA